MNNLQLLTMIPDAVRYMQQIRKIFLFKLNR